MGQDRKEGRWEAEQRVVGSGDPALVFGCTSRRG